MKRLMAVAVLAALSCAVGCETGSQQENMANQGVKGQNVGQNSNKPGPVPSSTTGTDSVAPAPPPQQQQQTAPDSAGPPAPRK